MIELILIAISSYYNPNEIFHNYATQSFHKYADIER